VLANVNGPLAVYQVRGDGALKRLQEVPAWVEGASRNEVAP
jgi:hypothetical protein